MAPCVWCYINAEPNQVRTTDKVKFIQRRNSTPSLLVYLTDHYGEAHVKRELLETHVRRVCPTARARELFSSFIMHIPSTCSQNLALFMQAVFV